jgi:hypothetical protein
VALGRSKLGGGGFHGVFTVVCFTRVIDKRKERAHSVLWRGRCVTVLAGFFKRLKVRKIESFSRKGAREKALLPPAARILKENHFLFFLFFLFLFFGLGTISDCQILGLGSVHKENHKTPRILHIF